jgi:hypothetical protein
VSFIGDLLDSPPVQSTLSKYTVLNGVIYLATGVLLIFWPGATQTLFFDPPFVGHEEGLMRALGLTMVVIGWLYFFGGRSGARQFAACTVIDRLIFVPLVLVPLGVAGVFPHLFLTLAILDPILAIGTWVIRSRKASLS